MPDVEPGKVSDERPQFRTVAPKSLFVEVAYQRNISERSVTLIRRIVREWSWRKFKPPVCAEGADGALCVIDGQHTAIAAASHPGIDKIPVMVVDAANLDERAAAFLGHNRDRVAVTPMQMHFAALAAGDEVAVAVARACEKAGVVILRSVPQSGIWEVGQTVAAGTLNSVVSRRGHNGGARLLEVLVSAARAPVTSTEIKAVEALLFEAEWKDDVNAFDLTTVIRSKSPADWQAHAEARVRRGRKMPLFRALAIAWFQALPKRRGRS